MMAFIRVTSSLGSAVAAVGLAWGVLAVASPAAAAIDGSVAVLCSPGTIMECDADKCERDTADDADWPSFVRIDVPNRLISALPAGRKTSIKTVLRLDGRLILQGSENGRSWTATIAEDTGKLSMAVADRDYVFAIFGACIVP